MLDLTLNSGSYQHGHSIRTGKVSVRLTGCSLVPGEGSDGLANQPGLARLGFYMDPCICLIGPYDRFEEILASIDNFETKTIYIAAREGLEPIPKLQIIKKTCF